MPPKSFFQPEQAEYVQSLLNQGTSMRAIARQFGCDHGTVQKFVRKHNLTRPAHKLLVIDIETMANLCWCWGTWQQNVAPSQIVKHKRVISFAAKWVGSSKVEFYSEFHNSREEMIAQAWALLSEADAVIGYNSKRFDVKHLNTEFKLAGYGPPHHFQQIDLLAIGRREFAFSSNKLESVADRLGIGKKREHEGFGLWLKCEARDRCAWKRMREYNMNDVVLTEKLFEEFRDWIPLRGSQSNKQVTRLLDAA